MKVNEKPILFSAPMVRAILAGQKTQTRRIMKPQPISNGFGKPGADTGWEIPCHCPWYPPSAMLWPDEEGGMLDGDAGHPWVGVKQLWVRETFALLPEGIAFRATHKSPMSRDWTPSIFMRRKYCRLVLEIVDVRAERLNSISEEDARAEGGPPILRYRETYREWYAWLWDSINGADSWKANPWVWVITFRRVEP